MDLKFTFLGEQPSLERISVLRGKLLSVKEFALRPGVAVGCFAPDRAGTPPEYWFINRIVVEQMNEVVLIMEKGNPLQPVRRSELEVAVSLFVTDLATKPIPPQKQVTVITDFIAEYMKGKVYAGA